MTAKTRKPKVVVNDMATELQVMKGQVEDIEQPPVNDVPDPITQLMSSVTALRIDLNALRADFDQLKAQPPAQPVKTSYVQSPKQLLRWSAVRQAKDKLKAGESETIVSDFLSNGSEFASLFEGLSAEDKSTSVLGIVKIALIQSGKRS